MMIKHKNTRVIANTQKKIVGIHVDQPINSV
jgi:hypothetical protein